MKVIYIEEHKNCQHYASGKCVFLHYYFDKDCLVNIDAGGCYAFIFVLAGRLNVSWEANTRTHELSENFMYSLDKGHLYSLNNLSQQVDFVVLTFEKPIIQCDKFSMLSLKKHLSRKSKESIQALPLIPPIKFFLDGMLFYIKKQLYCRHIQDLKQSEWFFLMRFFFTKEQNAAFFHSLIKMQSSFEAIVAEKSQKANSVKELAELCCMTERTLHRKFKECFNVTPKGWLDEQKKQKVELTLLSSDSDLENIASSLGFSSGSHLGVYCKKFFNKTPSEIKKEFTDKPISSDTEGV